MKKRLRKEKWEEKQKQLEEQYKLKGITADKAYLEQPAAKVESMKGNKKKTHDTFGWDVFNEDSLFRAYKKRLKAMPHYEDVYKQQMDNPNKEIGPNDERLNNLVEDIEKQEKKRAAFSRKRTFNDDEDITYINQRNQVFNQKLQRSFGEYTAEIKQNLERGSAL